MESLPTGPMSQLLNDVLVWIGYGTVIGLLAKAVMPGRDPGGTLTTLAMGIVGVIIGCGTWTLVQGGRITPISWPGLICGTAGAALILLFYRLLGASPAYRSATLRRRTPAPAYRRRRPYRVDFYEE